jgi:hypothetical protein
MRWPGLLAWRVSPVGGYGDLRFECSAGFLKPQNLLKARVSDEGCVLIASDFVFSFFTLKYR